MPIRFVCPLGHPLIVPDELAGTQGQCPTCRQRLVVPVADPSASPPAADLVDAPPIQRADSPGNSDPLVGVEPGAVALPPPLPPVVTPAADHYVADASWRYRTYAVAVGFGMAGLAGAWLALAALQRSPAPAWSWIVLLLSLLQAAYVLWLVSLPDWSTLWIGAAIYLAATAVDALGLGLVLAMPATRALPLGLESVRGSLAGWFGAALFVHAGLAFAAGMITRAWRREYDGWRVEQASQR